MKTNNFYKEIYFISNPGYLRNKQWNNFLMVGEKNWDHYFLPFKTKKDVIQAYQIEFRSLR